MTALLRSAEISAPRAKPARSSRKAADLSRCGLFFPFLVLLFLLLSLFLGQVEQTVLHCTVSLTDVGRKCYQVPLKAEV